MTNPSSHPTRNPRSPRNPRITRPHRTHTLPAFPARPADGHKGTFGTVTILSGSPTMPGAPTLVARAALRTGTGLVRLAAQQSLLNVMLPMESSATGLLRNDQATDEQCDQWFADHTDEKTVLAVGPGMGQSPAAERWAAAALRQSRPMVLDADGINLLAKLSSKATLTRPHPWVITPHAGEYDRLAKALELPQYNPSESTRQQCATALANRLNATVVLKGQHTLVTDGQTLFRNTTGNPALATAGSGDVLTGVIASLIGQHLSPFDAACLGVFLHGLAADLWVAERGPVGLLARELADSLLAAIAQWSQPHG